MQKKSFLFIGGAPRSGTTFLFNLLKQHPEICPHQKNESYFFMDKLHPLCNPKCNYYSNNLEDYLKYFKSLTTKIKYLLDGTDHLMYQDEMINVIKDLPKKKMIFILREPASRILSSFEFTKYNLNNFKRDVNFQQYIDGIKQQDETVLNDWFYSDKRSGYILKREMDYSHYYKYLINWINAIGQENVYIIQFESFVNNVTESLFKLFQWLKIDEKIEIKRTKAKQNASINIKYPLIHSFISQIHKISPKSSLKIVLKDYYLSIQKKEKELKEETIEVLEKLKNNYTKSNQQLLSIVNFDAKLWQ